MIEARICRIAKINLEIDQHFVIVFESERVDCELYLNFMILIEKRLDKLFDFFQFNNDVEMILYIKLKNVTSFVDKKLII